MTIRLTRMPYTRIFLLILCFASMSFWTDVSSNAAGWPDCSSREYESQAKQNECASQNYRTADKALNAQYKATKSRLNAAQQAQLTLEQREWLKKLKPFCEESAGPRQEAGNMWDMEFSDCMAHETESRTKALKQWTAK